jgi:Rps23 Pro-64 3,4-dihydroxylase Tpa1-like proline 4-hydroxylase
MDDLMGFNGIDLMGFNSNKHGDLTLKHVDFMKRHVDLMNKHCYSTITTGWVLQQELGFN